MLACRYDVIPLLIIENREQEAAEVLKRYDEETARELYLTAQVEFRREGPKGRSAQAAIAAAIQSNPHVIELLMTDEMLGTPQQFVLGSPEEAAVVIEEQLASWVETDGFVEWMFNRFTAWEREQKKRERERKRKLDGKAGT